MPMQTRAISFWTLKKRTLSAVFALSLASGLGLATAANAQDATTRLAKIGPVTTASAGIDRVFFGRVVARQTVDLAFQVGGQILQLPVDEGETLEAGSLIAQLDLEPFELSLSTARATKDQTNRRVTRFRRLEGNAVSPVTVEDAETEDALAGIAVSDAERSLRLATLTAPFTSVVASRNVSNFTTISAGTPIVRLHDMSDLRMEIEVPELVFQRAGANPDIELTAQFPASPTRFPVEFREFNAETTAVGQTYTITLGMAPPDGLAILPGSSVTVHARLISDDIQLEVPAAALMIDNDGGTSVMVFAPAGGDEGTVTRTDIVVEPTSNGAVRVLSGLTQDQEIVLSGAALLNDGETVRRFAGFSN